MKNIHKVSINHGLDYIDFYFANQENPTRVEGCCKYRKKLDSFLNELFKEIETEFSDKKA